MSAESRTAVLAKTATPIAGRERDRLSDLTQGAISAGLAVLWLFFAWASFTAWEKNGRPAGIGAVVLELVLVALFIARRPPEESSRAVFDWVVTLAAFTLLVARPLNRPPTSTSWAYEAVQLVGVAGALWALLALGRSFGLVAANRGLQTHGPYRFVRHPIYAFYFIVWVGYVLESPTARNIAIFSLAGVCQIVRIHREEIFLSRDASYRAYRHAVRYRLIPRVY